jgi:hypothetical protein
MGKRDSRASPKTNAMTALEYSPRINTSPCSTAHPLIVLPSFGSFARFLIRNLSFSTVRNRDGTSPGDSGQCPYLKLVLGIQAFGANVRAQNQYSFEPLFSRDLRCVPPESESPLETAVVLIFRSRQSGARSRAYPFRRHRRRWVEACFSIFRGPWSGVLCLGSQRASSACQLDGPSSGEKRTGGGGQRLSRDEGRSCRREKRLCVPIER